MAMEESLFVLRHPFHRSTSVATTSTAGDPDGAWRSHVASSWFGSWIAPAVATPRPDAAATVAIHDDALRRGPGETSRDAPPVERSIDYPKLTVAATTIATATTAATTATTTATTATATAAATCPGFALFQMAQALQRLGRHREALEKATECLALQREHLRGRGGGVGAQRVAGEEVANEMTALDLRTSFVTSVSRSVLGMLKGSTTNCQRVDGPPPRPSLPPNSRLPSFASTLASQCPLHPAVARTLLLRGQLLTQCTEDGADLDEAVQHLEAGVALLRESGAADDAESAVALALLGDLRSRADTANASHDEVRRVPRTARARSRAVTMRRGRRARERLVAGHWDDLGAV